VRGLEPEQSCRPEMFTRLLDTTSEQGSSKMTRKALVAEDSLVQRAAICRILKAFGWEVIQAENGKHAMEMVLEQDGIDLIVLDWQMPVMDGLEFLSIFRSMPEFVRNPKVMMMSAKQTMPAIVRAISAPADEYVMKPFTIEVLANKLQMMGFSCELPDMAAVEEEIFSEKMVDRVKMS